MRKKLSLLLFANIAAAGCVLAQNPFVSNQFTADPTARVFEGRVYVYPSHDIQSPVERLKEWFCMEDYHVFSSENMVDWTDHGTILSQKNVPWVNSEGYSMWAPDCVFKDNKYYFYFPSVAKDTTQRGFSIGVAVADKPYGPFTPKEQPIQGVNGIDPCVLIDRDNQAYLYWSGRGMFAAKLNDNMTELSSEPVQIENLPEGFKEGPFVFERQGLYYYTFPWVKDKTETLAYAMGKHPLGPFEFKGLIMDESPSGCWTNHHSITEYNDQWYLFYHHNDYSPEFDKNRSIRVDSLFFNADGTIQKVTPTLRGVGLTNAKSKIQMDRYTSISDQGASIDFVDAKNKFEGWKTILDKKGAWIQYNSVDFGEHPVVKAKANVKSKTGGVLVLKTTESGNAIVSRIEVPKSEGWIVVEAPVIKAPAGVKNLIMTLEGDSNIEADWISFE